MLGTPGMCFLHVSLKLDGKSRCYRALRAQNGESGWTHAH